MKRFLAFLLVLTMVIPMGMVAQAEEAADIKPFFLLQRQGFKSDLSNVYPMAFLWTNSAKLDDPLTCVAVGDDYDTAVIAKKLKAQFDQQPAGTRYLNFGLVQTSFHKRAENAIFVEEAVEICDTWLRAFLEEFHAIGGVLDGVMTDLQFEDQYAVYLESRHAVNDPLIYDKIVKNPLYATEIRPKLVERGFQFYSPVTPGTPEIFSIHSSVYENFGESRSIWDAVLRSYINGKVTEACKSVWEYYPDAVITDYKSKSTKPWDKVQNDFGGYYESGGIYTAAGNSSNDNYYTNRPYSFFENPSTHGPAYGTIPRYNRTQFAEKPFHYFLYEANMFKQTYASASGQNVNWWIAHYFFNTQRGDKSTSNSPYYAETILHLGMLNPSSFLGYIIQTEIEKVGTEDDYELSLQIADDILKELTRVVGAADRKPLDVVPMWNESYVLSGMYAGGKNYYRITPDIDVISLESFKVADTADPTFYVNGVTVTFPGGKIIETGAVRKIGTCGYWVETSADVKPVVTKCAEYFKAFPAYGETYDTYAIDTEYTFKTALPVACWEARKSGSGSGKIVADPDNANNQVLALTGNYSLKNVNLPKNVTAGDSYAEHQAWEVTVSIPEDMAAESEVVLLNVIPEKKKSTDGGVKIAGGKLYYDNAGQYVEMPNFTVIPNTKYTIVREMDFTGAGETYKSSYRVYDAAGSLLANAENVPTAPMDIPVYSINLAVSDVAGAAVLLDNYKLYQTKVGYDFDLYDTKTGIKVKETGKAQPADVTYRFSWLNTAQTEKTYSVVASYYNGDTLVSEKVIKEVKLAPNADGLEIGNVENIDGQTLLVSLRDENPADEDPKPVPNPGDTPNKKGGNKNTVIILVVCTVALLLVGEVVFLMVSANKKKNKKAVRKNVSETDKKQ